MTVTSTTGSSAPRAPPLHVALGIGLRASKGVDFDACMEWANEAISATDADDRTVAAAYLRRVRGSGMVHLFERDVDTKEARA